MKKLLAIFVLVLAFSVALGTTEIRPDMSSPYDFFLKGRDTVLTANDTFYTYFFKNMNTFSEGTFWYACSTKGTIDSVGIQLQFAPFLDESSYSGLDSTWVTPWYSLYMVIPATDSVGYYYLANFNTDGWVPALGFFRSRWISYDGDAADSFFVCEAQLHMAGSQ